MNPVEDIKNKLLPFGRHRKLVEWSFKLFITVLLIYILYDRLLIRMDFDRIYNEFNAQEKSKNILWFIGAVILVVLNWWTEALRWRFLSTPFATLTPQQSFKSVLTGLSIGMITPGKLGEFGGRSLYIDYSKTWKVGFGTIIGSFMMTLTILFWGILSGIYSYIQGWFDISQSTFYISLAGAIILFIAVFYLFFSPQTVFRLIRYIPFNERISRFLERNLSFINEYRKKDIACLLLLSFLRSVIFTVQYILLMRFYGADVLLSDSWACISIIFFIQACIPLPPFLETIWRGGIALMIWKVLNINELIILSASYSLWIINLGIPALIGLFLILKLNISKSIGYETKND